MDTRIPHMLTPWGFNSSGASLRGIEVEKVLCDEKALLEILEVCSERNKLYGNVQQFLLRSGKGSPCFLLDFDIIYGYLVGGIAGKTLFAEIDYFFEVSNLEYAIPQGAFEELLEYLKDTSINELLKEVNAPSMREDDLVDILESFVRESSSSLNEQYVRLLNILVNDRFRGIVYKYDSSIKDEALVLLESDYQAERHRHGNRERSDNMRRDAENLAIVLSQYDTRFKNAKLSQNWFVLLSCTSSVNKISRKLCRARSISPWATVIPRLLILAEFLGFESNKDRAFYNTRAILEGWQRLENKISERLHYLKNDPLDKLDRDAKSISNELKREIDRLLDSEASIRTEKAICQFRSIEELQLKQLKRSTSDVPRLNAKRECLRVLDTLRGALADLEPAEVYNIIELLASRGNRTVGIRPDSKSFSCDLLITLSFLLDNAVSKGLWASWDISCDDKRFVAALTDLAPDLDSNSLSRNLLTAKIINRENESDLLNADGIIVRNASFAYYFSLATLKVYGGWNTLCLPDLYHLQRVFGTHLSSSDEAWARYSELIHEIRCKTGGLAITYEVIPQDKSAGRQISVFSAGENPRFAKDVALLYDWTGMRFAYKPVLEKAIGQAIKSYISGFELVL